MTLATQFKDILRIFLSFSAKRISCFEYKNVTKFYRPMRYLHSEKVIIIIIFRYQLQKWGGKRKQMSALSENCRLKDYPRLNALWRKRAIQHTYLGTLYYLRMYIIPLTCFTIKLQQWYWQGAICFNVGKPWKLC